MLNDDKEMIAIPYNARVTFQADILKSCYSWASPLSARRASWKQLNLARNFVEK